MGVSPDKSFSLLVSHCDIKTPLIVTLGVGESRQSLYVAGGVFNSKKFLI